MIRKISYTDSKKFQIIKQQYTLDSIDYTDGEAIIIIDKNTLNKICQNNMALILKQLI